MPVCFGELGLNCQQIGDLTPYEVVNMYHGNRVRHREFENTIASLVTIWIANTAGKSLKKELTLKNLFRDGRFGKNYSREEIDDILEELDNGRKEN